MRRLRRGRRTVKQRAERAAIEGSPDGAPHPLPATRRRPAPPVPFPGTTETETQRENECEKAENVIEIESVTGKENEIGIVIGIENATEIENETPRERMSVIGTSKETENETEIEIEIESETGTTRGTTVGSLAVGNLLGRRQVMTLTTPACLASPPPATPPAHYPDDLALTP